MQIFIIGTFYLSRHAKFHTFSNEIFHSLSFIHNCRWSLQFSMKPPFLSRTFWALPRMERAHLLNHKHLKMLSLKWRTHLRRTWLAPREATSWSSWDLRWRSVWGLMEYTLAIPDICHFFYTGKIFGEQNLHRNLHSKLPIYTVNCQFFALNL